MYLERFKQFIKKEKLFPKKGLIIVALSGGADSVALLHLLLQSGYHCEAAHCNFHLRNEESDRDEAFVQSLCQSLNIPLFVSHFNTTAHASEQHISIEMAARELRYQWFEELRVKRGAAYIAVAHHQDDSIETMLLNLIRGTGINGLLGIHPINQYIHRPLLCLNRQEILEYLQQMGQAFVTDSTNLQDDFTRNKIRLKLLPLMEEINPSVRKTLLRLMENLNGINNIYSLWTEKAKQRVMTPQGICIEKLLLETSPETLLFEWLHPLGFNNSQIKRIHSSLTGQAGKCFYSTSWRVIKDRELLLIEPRDISSLNAMPENNVHPPFELQKEEQILTPEFTIPRSKEYACFDTDKLNEPLTIRKWKKGDWFIPFGMKGRKKISDYLTDRKFSISQKEQQWVMCCGNRIAWLIGERTDNRFRVDEKTKKVVIYKRI